VKLKAIIHTFLSRFLILILSFGLVIFSTNMWGSDGKGVISIVTADLAMVIFFSNIFSGSSVSYFAPKHRQEQIMIFAYLWSLIVGITVPLVLGVFHPNEFTYYLIGMSILSSLLSANINLFIGRQNIRMYNFYTVMQLLVFVVLILGFIYVLKIESVRVYFLAQIVCLSILFLTSFFQIIRHQTLSGISFSRRIGAGLFSYGWKSQLSAFLQFLNNRLSFYYLEFFRGLTSVGIFSVGVACSEAIWTVSRSLALVLYSDIINSDNPEESLLRTKISMKMSFSVTLLFIVIILLIPADLYTMVFGKDFRGTKKIILLLSPGILAIAVSNIIGFYFAGINMMKILNIKSIVGLLFTAVCSLYFIPKWGISGACIVTSVSYCLSSGLLLWKFYQLTDFHITDFIISKSEMKILLIKLKK